MRSLRGLVLALGCTALVGLSAGCSKAPATAPTITLERVTGVVTSIVDMRPADGGVDLTVAATRGSEQVFSLGSLRMIGANDQPDLQLHALVSTLVVGDRVIATGERQGSRVVLTSLRRLSPR